MVRWPCANGVYLGVGILQVWPRVHQVLPRAQNRRRVRPWHTFPLRFISIVCTCSHYFPLSLSISVHISCICQFRYIKNSSSRLLVMFSFILPYVCSAKYISTCEPIPVLRRILSSVTTHNVAKNTRDYLLDRWSANIDGIFRTLVLLYLGLSHTSSNLRWTNQETLQRTNNDTTLANYDLLWALWPRFSNSIYSFCILVSPVNLSLLVRHKPRCDDKTIHSTPNGRGPSHHTRK